MRIIHVEACALSGGEGESRERVLGFDCVSSHRTVIIFYFQSESARTPIKVDKSIGYEARPKYRSFYLTVRREACMIAQKTEDNTVDKTEDSERRRCERWKR